jgi:hypothetical protein
MQDIGSKRVKLDTLLFSDISGLTELNRSSKRLVFDENKPVGNKSDHGTGII